MASKLGGILSPTAEPTPRATDQPAQNDNSKNNMTTTSESRSRAATAPPQDQHSTREREDGFRAQSLESRTHLEQAKDTSQPPSNKNTSTSENANPNNAPTDPHDAAITIAALRQQLYIAEQHILHSRNEASNHIFQLENLVRSSWDRSNDFEANVNYLLGELHKANGYNGTLNQHIIELRKEAETTETKHQAALQAANAKIRASSSRTPSAPPPPPPLRLPAVMQDTNTLLQHNRASIVKLRAEIRELKASKKQLQERLLTLGSVPPLDGSTFLQSAGLPREVLDEWSQVLLQRDREIAGLRVMIEEEREAR